MSADREPRSLTAARQQYEVSAAAERRARVAAAPEIRRRQARRRSATRWATVVLAVCAVVGVITAAVLVWSGASDRRRLDDDAAARLSATTAIAQMLTADPGRADDYVARILASTTGEQHDRISDARVQLRDAVVAEAEPTSGQVLSAGVSGGSGDDREVVVVAQASAPSLLGAPADDQRIVVRVSMSRIDDRWLVAKTEVVS